MWLDARHLGAEFWERRFPTILARLPRARRRPGHRADPGRAGPALRVRRRRHRPVGTLRPCRGSTPPARSPAPASTAPTGWPPTRCSRGWSSPAGSPTCCPASCASGPTPADDERPEGLVDGDLRRDLQDMMTTRVGVLRHADGLAEALALLRRARATATAEVGPGVAAGRRPTCSPSAPPSPRPPRCARDPRLPLARGLPRPRRRRRPATSTRGSTPTARSGVEWTYAPSTDPSTTARSRRMTEPRTTCPAELRDELAAPASTSTTSGTTIAPARVRGGPARRLGRPDQRGDHLRRRPRRGRLRGPRAGRRRRARRRRGRLLHVMGADADRHRPRRRRHRASRRATSSCASPGPPSGCSSPSAPPSTSPATSPASRPRPSHWVEALEGTTDPGARHPQDPARPAARCRSTPSAAAAGVNHRSSLQDMAMVKDNHVIAAGGVLPALEAIRGRLPGLPVEVEVTTSTSSTSCSPCPSRRSGSCSTT